jgi:hypothetical protein
MDLKGIGAEFAPFYARGLYQSFANRKQGRGLCRVGADALAKWISVAHEQGVSKHDPNRGG